MATFILIHGAWHGGWSFERLTPLLTAAGHEVIAPDLPGIGQDTTAIGPDPLAQWAKFVTGLAASATGPVILVGHSRAGAVISEAAELAPENIDTLVYLTAFLLLPGQSLADVANAHPDVGPMHAFVPADDPSLIDIDRELGIPVFYNLTSEDDSRAAAKRLVPEPIASFTTPLRITPERFGRVRRVYIEAAHDRAISLEMQREMQAKLPCETVVTLQSDHSPFYSTVPELAQALLDLV